MNNSKLDMLQNNKFMIFGPGRTGSKLIVDLIRHSFHRNNLPFHYFEPIHTIEDLPKDFFIWHHHNIENYVNFLKPQFQNVTKILSTRNMIDSTYSWAIVRRTNQFHIYGDQKIEINPFFLPISEFLETYNNIKNFYSRIKSKLDNDTLIIDYDSYVNNNNYILNILNLPIMEIDSKSRITKKNVGTHEEWIANFQEINEVAKKLSPNPCF